MPSCFCLTLLKYCSFLFGEYCDEDYPIYFHHYCHFEIGFRWLHWGLLSLQTLSVRKSYLSFLIFSGWISSYETRMYQNQFQSLQAQKHPLPPQVVRSRVSCSYLCFLFRWLLPLAPPRPCSKSYLAPFIWAPSRTLLCLDLVSTSGSLFACRRTLSLGWSICFESLGIVHLWLFRKDDLRCGLGLVLSCQGSPLYPVVDC